MDFSIFLHQHFCLFARHIYLSLLRSVVRSDLYAKMYLHGFEDSSEIAFEVMKHFSFNPIFLGIVYNRKQDNLDDEIEALIEERQQARKSRNFARADEIRDLLKAQGIVLEDTPQGVKWHRA